VSLNTLQREGSGSAGEGAGGSAGAGNVGRGGGGGGGDRMRTGTRPASVRENAKKSDGAHQYAPPTPEEKVTFGPGLFASNGGIAQTLLVSRI